MNALTSVSWVGIRRNLEVARLETLPPKSQGGPQRGGRKGRHSRPLCSALQTQPTHIGPSSVPCSEEHCVRNPTHCTSSVQTQDSPDLPGVVRGC